MIVEWIQCVYTHAYKKIKKYKYLGYKMEPSSAYIWKIDLVATVHASFIKMACTLVMHAAKCLVENSGIY